MACRLTRVGEAPASDFRERGGDDSVVVCFVLECGVGVAVFPGQLYLLGRWQEFRSLDRTTHSCDGTDVGIE